MLTEIVFLLVGIALIVKGGDWFVASAVRIAEFLRMPRVVVGSTLVSLATSSPELVVAIMAGLKGAPGLAVGNAVGSCICNLGLILGLMAAIKQVDIHPKTLRTPMFVMFAAGIALLLMTLDLKLARWQGLLLLAAGVGYFAWDFYRHWRDRKPRDLAEAAAIEKELEAGEWPGFRTKPGTALQFLLGAVLVVVGSRLLVDGATGLAGRLGIPNIIIGLTVVAVGTSLPEMVTAITSSRKAVSDLAVGNVLGANIANLTLIIGVAAVIGGVTMDRMTQRFNFPALLVIMGLALYLLLNDRRLSRREGVLLLAVYGLYIGILVSLTVWIH